ncbi:hypothetical protein ACFP81_00020 [Deinococcus lacus]|uniref:5'-nucleotidase n=1 Tax=Deinococcus lacus TaxID=392561 RepID=A0ABW1Y9B0_9DEIO
MKNLLPLTLPLLLTACQPAALPAEKARGVQKLTIVGVNDLHGNLQPSSFRGKQVPDPKDPSKTVSALAGGIEAIGGQLAAIRAENPNTAFVGVGDLTGASPLISALLRDEPTIVAMNKLGMSVSALGNHEFDYGVSELMRLQKGGCASNDPEKACKFGPFAGAEYPYIAANVFDKDGKHVFPLQDGQGRPGQRGLCGSRS